MARDKSSLYISNDFNGYGQQTFLQGTDHTYYEPPTQKYANSSQDFRSFVLKSLGTMPLVINPLNTVFLASKAIGAMAVLNRVIVKQNTSGFVFSFNIDKRTIRNGAYLQNNRYSINELDNSSGYQRGWKEVSNGWIYIKLNGELACEEWIQEKEFWYYFGKDQIMVTGWKFVNKQWYYFDPQKGYMKKGWEQVNGKWYYLRETDKKGEKVDSNYMISGWRKIDGEWYYFKTKQEDKTGGNNYGYMIADCWRKIGGSWYYFYSNGVLAVDTTIDGWYVDKNGVCQDSKGEEIDYGDYTEEDYNYLVALGTECPTYDGFLAVAYSVINRADEHNQSIREVVTAKNQYGGFRNSEIGKPKNEDVKQAAIDALSGAVPNPIGKATFFFGRVSNYDIWYESTKCHYIKEVDKNVFYVSEDYGYVHNMSSSKTSDAVVIYSSSQSKWLKRGLIVN